MMIHMKSAILVSLNMLFMVNLSHSIIPSMMMNSILRWNRGSLRPSSVLRDSLRRSSSSISIETSFEVPTRNRNANVFKPNFPTGSGHRALTSGRVERTIGATQAVPRKLFLTAPELIHKNNYPVEEHFATTPDGYILGLHRIPGPRRALAKGLPKGRRKKVVLLMHGLFGTSTSFLVNGPQYSLGFLLADAGYDVWLGNCRGNTYSRNHTSLNPDTQLKFWQFSQDEIASQDIPTTVRYALKHTGEEGLIYVGYSQGTRVMYLAASAQDSIIDKVDLFIAMASSGTREPKGDSLILNEIVGKIWRIPEAVGKGELLRGNPSKMSLLYWLCNSGSSLNRLCSKLLLGYFSRTLPDNPLVSQMMIPYILANLLSGASMRQFSHFSQFARGKLQKFDFGSSENRVVYGSSDPPMYDVSAVTCPTALYWGQNDPLTPEQDVTNLAAALPDLVSNYKVPHPAFNHLDFIFSTRAKDLLYDHIINLMSQY